MTIQWAAGLFDGEGCITRQQSRYILALGMTDEAVVRVFAGIIGVPWFPSVLHHSRRNPRWHDAFYWRVFRQADVQRALVQLVPYLVAKRAQAEHALRHLTQKR